MNPTLLSHPSSLLGFVRHGTGPECVLVLHDWLSDHTSYDPLHPYLDGSAFSYVFADLRGYGTSRHLTGRYTIDEMAQDCLALADHLGWSRFHVIGHSMTGMLTQRMAIDAPARIKRAIALCPLSAAGNPLDQAAYDFFARSGQDDDALLRLLRFVTGDRLSTQWAHHKLKQNREGIAEACRRPYLAMLTQTNFVAEVRGCKTPYLVVIGDHDPGIDAAAMQQTFLAWHPHAELLTIPNCGHYPMQECPPYLAEVIERFLHRERVTCSTD